MKASKPSKILCLSEYRDDRVLVGGTLTTHFTMPNINANRILTQICKSSDNDNEDVDDSEFPPILEVISNYWKERRVKRGLSSRCASEAGDKLALDVES